MVYSKTIDRAISYIVNNITNDITVSDVARHCNFSRHHFSRMFKSATGESVCGFIKRFKLEQSAFRLKVSPSLSITDICLDYGYSSSNFSSAFTKFYDVSPFLFRNAPVGIVTHPIFGFSRPLEGFEECSSKITIEVLPDFSVIYERALGNYGSLSEHWDDFLYRYRDFVGEDTLILERTYNDPTITDVDACLYDICISFNGPFVLPNVDVIQGGRFAVYHFRGHVSEIFFAYQSIYYIWLPQSKFLVDNRYNFDIYRQIDCETMFMEIDFCIPIK